MLSTEEAEAPVEEPSEAPDLPSEARVRCKAQFLKKWDRRRCYRDDIFTAPEEWIVAHEGDLERL